jgi:hypothetical protein
LADQESLKVLCDQPACGWTTKSSSEALRSICGFELDTEGSKDIDAPRCPRLAVLFILAHGRADLAIDQPMSAMYIVVVLSIVSRDIRWCLKQLTPPEPGPCVKKVLMDLMVGNSRAAPELVVDGIMGYQFKRQDRDKERGTKIKIYASCDHVESPPKVQMHPLTFFRSISLRRHTIIATTRPSDRTWSLVKYQSCRCKPRLPPLSCRWPGCFSSSAHS